MILITRRSVVMAAAGGTLATVLGSGKSCAEDLQSLGEALKPVNPPVQAPDVAFVDASGDTHHLSEFHGHGIVINLWATWCVPCVAEMPSLAALSQALAPSDIAVLPLSSDRGGANAVQAFYAKHGITGLPVLLDPRSAAEQALDVRGIPTSIVIDTAGREVARLEGAADWSTSEAAAAVRLLVAV